MTRIEATDKTPGGTLTVSYTSLVAPLVKAVQELKALFDGDRAELMRLKAANDNHAAALKALEAEFKAYKAAHP